MLNDKEKRRQVVYLLNMDRRKIEAMDEDELVRTIERVDEVRVDAVKEGRFLDADNAKKMLKTLRDTFEKLKRRDVKTQHGLRRQKLDEDFQREMESFTELWSQKILNYQEECHKLEEEHLEANRQDLEAYRDSLEQSLPARPKDSSRMIDLKSKIEQLVRVQEYKDAHYLQQRAHELESAEVDKYLVERQRKIDNLLEQRVLQHQNEYNSLRKRVLNGLDELEQQRKAEYDRLCLKFNNMRKNIETQQSMQSHLINKSMRAASMNASFKQYCTMGSLDQLQNESQDAR